MVTQNHSHRLRRAARAAAEQGIDAVVVSPSADLLYLTGYDPPPLERLTCLLIRSDRDPTLVVPALERPLAESSGIATLVDLVHWNETDDPYRLVADRLGEAERVGCSERMWASHLLRLEEAVQRATFVPAQSVLAPLRAVKDVRELGLLRRAARAADETFRRVVSMRLETMTERELATRLAELLVQMGHD
ncbi:MAG TPA: aminopeptidase P family N-terminal domain-containing protein, partial [Actinomycetota bacterium]|nr:aminopeptidase P family N-terminal domain-containing protein [Actinomycetota bacterium]